VVDPTTLIAIVDARRNNSGVVKTDGIDFNFLTTFLAISPISARAQANYTFTTRPRPFLARY
jgi:iron complex outermembrane receptor protein